MEQVALFFIAARKALIENIISNLEDNKELWNLAHTTIKAENH